MARKQFSLVVVRHGQATHNLDTFQRKDLVLTEEPDMPFMNSPLTELGQKQAGLVADRLSKTKFHLGIASDLSLGTPPRPLLLQTPPSKRLRNAAW